MLQFFNHMQMRSIGGWRLVLLGKEAHRDVLRNTLISQYVFRHLW